MRQTFENIQSFLTIHILELLWTLGLALLIIIANFLHYNILSIVQEEKAESLLVYIALYLIIAILLLLITLWYFHRLKFALGAYWDRRLNPHCNNCKKILGNYKEREIIKGEWSPSYWCKNCKGVVLLYDDEKKYLGIEDARKTLIERKLFKNTKTN